MPTARSLVLPILTLLAFALPLAAQGLKPPALLEGMAPDANELDLRTTPVVRAVQRAADSVVSIYMLDSRSPDARTALEGQGSGVIVDASGLVITNWHVVAPVVAAPTRHRLQVRLRDGHSYESTVLSSSPEHDLALLQLAVRGETVKPIAAGRSGSLMIGETVIAIGNPQGQANTVTVGVLSAIDRSIKVPAPDGTIRDYQGLLQTDAAINRGNSGGALLDITGKLIGINNAMANDAENIGFAIPVDTVKRVFQDVLLSSDNLANVWLGLSLDDSDAGTVVGRVDPFGPAARAGVQVGDRVREVLGRQVANKLDFTRTVATARPGEAVPILLLRDGRAVNVKPMALSGVDREILLRTGLELEAVTASEDRPLLERASRAFYQGSGQRRVPLLPVAMRVRSVLPESPAADLGFETGDVLLGTRVRDFFGYRNVPVRSPQEFADWTRDVAGGKIFIVVLRGEEALEGEMDVRRL